MVTVVIPCFRVRNTILNVLSGIGSDVHHIIVVDDACPEKSGDLVREKCSDPRVEVLFHSENTGVGGAVITGYRKALADGANVIVKLDGDGQMDPAQIPSLIRPILVREADYVKGNRFYDFSFLDHMPLVRKVGNSMVSFISKMASGYWNIMDPSNGFTAISKEAAELLPLEKIDKRFFFESDMLFRLNTIRAVVADFPMRSTYADEKSNLRVRKVILEFPFKYLNRFIKRVFYNYFLRDFNIGSMELLIAFAFISFGTVFGAIRWFGSIVTQQPATAGTVLLAGLPVILGFQSLLAFLTFDVSNIPEKPLSKILSNR